MLTPCSLQIPAAMLSHKVEALNSKATNMDYMMNEDAANGRQKTHQRNGTTERKREIDLFDCDFSLYSV